jgi:hypothetical protein
MAADQSRSDDVGHDRLRDSLGGDSWVLLLAVIQAVIPKKR